MMDLQVNPTIAGAFVSAALALGGAPLFREGLHALRVTRKTKSLVERPLADLPAGFTGVVGTVALDSPLFSPITHQPCAGFRLTIAAEGQGKIATSEEHSAFRVVTGRTIAHVAGPAAFWRLTAGVQRDLKPDDTPSENLRRLLERSPEVCRLRRAGATLLLTEHLLAAGAQCHVVGHIRRSSRHKVAETELQRTGTDDAVAAPSEAPEPHLLGHPNLWIDGGSSVECLIVSDRPIAGVRLRHTRWQMAGLVAGPLLTLTGLIMLAVFATRLMQPGR
jgi:hypothetical protein